MVELLQFDGTEDLISWVTTDGVKTYSGVLSLEYNGKDSCEPNQIITLKEGVLEWADLPKTLEIESLYYIDQLHYTGPGDSFLYTEKLGVMSDQGDYLITLPSTPPLAGQVLIAGAGGQSTWAYLPREETQMFSLYNILIISIISIVAVSMWKRITPYGAMRIFIRFVLKPFQKNKAEFEAQWSKAKSEEQIYD
jgi:hypothetical protein